MALLYFHHSVSMAYFVSTGILALLLCGFLTSPCFKIPCRTPRRNVRPGGDSRQRVCPLGPRRPSGGIRSMFQPTFPATAITRFSARVTLTPWILTESEDILGSSSLGDATGIYWVEARKELKYPSIHRTPLNPQSKTSLSTNARCWGGALGWAHRDLPSR